MYSLTFSLGIGFISVAIGGMFLWLFTRRTKDKEYLLFSLVCFSSAVYSFFATQVQRYHNDPISSHDYYKLMMCGPILMTPFLVHFISLFTKRQNKVILASMYLINFILILLNLFDFHFYTKEIVIHDFPFSEQQLVIRKPDWGFKLITPAVAYGLGYALFAFKSAYKRGIKYITQLLIGILILTFAAVYDMLWVNQIVVMIVPPLLEYGFLALVICMTFTLIARYVNDLSELENLKNHLEELVQQRTRELLEEKQKLQMAQAQLVQSEKMATIGTLAGGIAHEINNPIAAILSSAQRILKYPKDLKKHLESATNIEKASRYCRATIENLLFYSRKTDEYKNSINVNEIIKMALSKIDKLKDSNVQVITKFKSLPTIQASEIELTRLITNLLDNAYDSLQDAKHQRKQLKLTILTQQEDEWVKITIRDNGIGISEKDLSRLFDPFFTTKEIGKGTGLGLWLAYQIIQNHHGKISVRNFPQGGAEFQFCLPIKFDAS